MSETSSSSRPSKTSSPEVPSLEYRIKAMLDRTFNDLASCGMDLDAKMRVLACATGEVGLLLEDMGEDPAQFEGYFRDLVAGARAAQALLRRVKGFQSALTDQEDKDAQVYEERFSKQKRARLVKMGFEGSELDSS